MQLWNVWLTALIDNSFAIIYTGCPWGVFTAQKQLKNSS